MKIQNLAIPSLLAFLLAACGSGGSSGPSGPQYLPQGNYTVTSGLTGNTLTGILTCTITGAVTFAFSQTTATSDGQGHVTLNLIPTGQVTFDMDINKTPSCGTFNAESDTYTFTNCQNQGNGLFVMYTNDKNKSPIWESSGCQMVTNFKQQK